VRKVKGICSHFHRSTKVYRLILTFVPSTAHTIPEALLNHNCIQGWNALMELVSGRNFKSIRKPPCGAETRWAGFLPMLAWVNENKIYLQDYEAPETCMYNPDGTKYSEHALLNSDFNDVMQLVRATLIVLICSLCMYVDVVFL
jgi:hypothetical protein